jgi:6-phosphogluconolactonase
MTEIIRAKRPDLEKKAAKIIKDSISSIFKENEKVVLAIPAGRSVSGIFQLLKKENIPWQNVHVFMVDERMVPLDDKDSNFKLAKETFLDEIDIPKENVHPFLVEKGIKAYEGDLKVQGGAYDIVLLSAGEDGHVGALYPDHHSVQSESKYYLVMNDSPKPPPNRMTLSKNLLLRSKVALIMFLGEGKREALNKFLGKNIDYKSCPAKLVQSIKKSYLLTDLK